ncbi:hypothetical protein [Wolbachia endosymbiont of Pentidionis agamae]|uniref:hypothetical protein n=1 Tax=Wolbachia endosymbiont of Pentidionis agamae TaxID=3110435 RepID=UPI002FD541F8
MINKGYGQKLDAERSRRYDAILQLIYNEARNKGKVYTINTFSQVFENKAGLGSKNSIRERIDVLAAKGYIKFNRKDKNAERSKYGILCVEGMEKRVEDQSSENVTVYEKILPTDYKSQKFGDIVQVKDPNSWIYQS